MKKTIITIALILATASLSARFYSESEVQHMTIGQYYAAYVPMIPAQEASKASAFHYIVMDIEGLIYQGWI